MRGWDEYDKPGYLAGTPLFLAELAKIIGWLHVSEGMNPTRANSLREAMGIKPLDSWNPDPARGQALTLCRLLYRFTRSIPLHHPNDEGRWQLDQDRRCLGERFEYHDQ